MFWIILAWLMIGAGTFGFTCVQFNEATPSEMTQHDRAENMLFYFCINLFLGPIWLAAVLGAGLYGMLKK